MKKRILSCLMALALCLTLLPTAALAEEPEGTAQTSPAVEEAADPANGKAKQENQPTEQEEQQEDSATKQDEDVAAVQAMIDALPGAAELDGMDDADAMAVYEAFQAACEAYYDTLTEGQQAQLKNTEKLAALSDWFSQLETLAAGTHTHCVCGATHNNIGDHTAESQITFDKWLTSGYGPKNSLNLYYDEANKTSGKIVSQDKSNNNNWVLNGGNYYLRTDVENYDDFGVVKIDHTIVITGDVTICLNGQTIESKAKDMPVFEVVSGGKLTLTDCQGNKGKVTHFSDGTGCGVEVNGGKFNLYGGSISGNTAAKGSEGGGVRVCDGEFNMYGGSITRNNAKVSGNEGKGGGVRVGNYDWKKGTFNLYGGEISDNEAEYGGGVYVYDGTFTMSGGKITGNTATSLGGGVCVDSNTSITFNMSGGEISGNNKASSGGGVYVGQGTFNMSGGKITGNTATKYGGGVHMVYGTFTVSGAAVIKDNKKGTANNNVYLSDHKYITIGGTLNNGASIGVTTKSEPGADGAVIATGNNLTDKDAEKFISDKSGYAVSVNDAKDSLVLVKAHTHFLCGGNSCTKVGHTQETSMVTFKPWDKTNELPTTAGNYYLTDNVTLSSTWTPASGTVLCLNGHKITMDGNKISAIYVSDITFTLCDCKDGGKSAYGQITHTITNYGTHYEGSGVYVRGTGVFHMYGGSITNNTADNGGGVYVGGGQFTMYGGEISGNTATVSGGGVSVSGGTFTMSGGRITGNNGSGVFVNDNTKFIVSGAPTVTGNTRNRDIDSNVYLTGGTDTTITIGTGGLTDGASIGVTKGAGSAGSVIATGVNEDYSGKFFSDNSTYVVKYDNKQLVLAVPSAVTHTHSWQFTKETGNDSTIFVSCKGTPGSCDYKNTPATVKISMAQSTYLYSENMAAPKAKLIHSANWPKDVVKAQENDIKYWRSNDGGNSYKVQVANDNDLKKPGKYLAQLNFNGKWLEARFSVVDNGKQDPTYTAPTAKTGLVYNGTAQVLINEGHVEGCKMQYRLDNGGDYSDSLPTATDAGTYTVWYKVVGDDSHNNVVAEKSLKVWIEKAPLRGTPTFTKVTGAGKTLKDVAFTKADGWPDGEFKWDNGAAGYDMNAPLVQGKAYSWLYLADNYYAKGTVVLWADPSSGGSSGGGSSGGGGGSSSPSNHPVKAEVSKDPDGSVSLSKTSAAKGDKVTITVKPERHYEVDEVIVRDSKGKQLAVKDNGDGTFTFEMPADKVTVEPSFSWVNPFADVADSAYYVDAVEWMLKREVTQGTTETTFSPDLNCTRAQIVTFLWRVAGSPEAKGTVSFADVSADSYYAKAVAWAVENGITDGIGGGLFSPDATCTRAQSAVFLYRVAGSPAVNGSAGFSDVAADAYYAQAVAWAKEHGITDGIGGGLFGSANDCTRAQIAAFLYRYMK